MKPKDLLPAYHEALDLMAEDSTCIYDCYSSGATGFDHVGWIEKLFLGPGQTWIKDRCTVVDTPWSVFELEHLGPAGTTGPMQLSVWTDYTRSSHNGPITEVVLRTVSVPNWKNHVEIIGKVFANAAVQSYGTLGWTMHVPTHERLAMYIAYCSVYANEHGWDEKADGWYFENRPAEDVPWCDPEATGRPSDDFDPGYNTSDPDANPIAYYPKRNFSGRVHSGYSGSTRRVSTRGVPKKKAASSQKQRLTDFFAGPKRKR